MECRVNLIGKYCKEIQHKKSYNSHKVTLYDFLGINQHTIIDATYSNIY